MTDAELVVRVVAGDAGAFTNLVARHHSACLRYAAHVLGDRMEAEDVVQETLLRAYRSLGRYQERQQFRPWLFRILVNRCRTAAERRRVQRLRAEAKQRLSWDVPRSGDTSRTSRRRNLPGRAASQRQSSLSAGVSPLPISVVVQRQRQLPY